LYQLQVLSINLSFSVDFMECESLCPGVYVIAGMLKRCI